MRDTALTTSVITPTYNRREGLARLLAALEREAPHSPAFEAVVVVDGSTDGTQAMLAGAQTTYPLRVLEQANAGPAAARNRAIEAARGDVLVFLDDDVLPSPGLIARHSQLHADDPRAVATGPMLPPPGTPLAPWLEWEAATLQKQYDAMQAGLWKPSPRQFYTANASLRREHALAVHGFDESFRRAEDVELAYRLADRGLRFYFLPDAVVLHQPDRTLAGWQRVAYDYGRYDVIMGRGDGRRDLLLHRYQEARERHPLNRALAGWCVGHRRRFRAGLGLASWLVQHPGPLRSRRSRIALCSAIFNLQYWQGIADETGFSGQIWRHLREQWEAAVVNAPAVFERR
jgi:glycosyltransferase involved in cell wall biosynthesis